MGLLDNDEDDKFEFWAGVICFSFPIFCLICNAVDMIYRLLVNLVS